HGAEASLTRPGRTSRTPRLVREAHGHVVVTGGSSGIGAAIAEGYARRGYRVSLIARMPARLAERKRDLEARFGAGRFHTEAADVRDGPRLGAAIARCEAALGPCDVLVAAAGVVEPSPFVSQPA